LYVIGFLHAATGIRVKVVIFILKTFFDFISPVFGGDSTIIVYN